MGNNNVQITSQFNFFPLRCDAELSRINIALGGKPNVNSYFFVSGKKSSYTIYLT